LKVHRVKRCSV
ncbi:semialdehyde dehydrogenase, dimerization domain protein, partial [Vibrio parahaemolyticus VPTS-2010]